MQHKKRGLPKALEAELNDADNEHGAEPVLTPEEFAREFFGDANVEGPDNEYGMPNRSWLKEQFKTKSAAIRFLINKGFKVKDIAKHLDIKYQHVRNVATGKLKRGPNEDWRPKSEREGSNHEED